MTTFNTNTNTAPRLSAGVSAPWILRVLKRIRAASAERAERQRTYKALRALTDRELDDIGLTRSDVNALH